MKPIFYLKYIISLICSVIICFSEQIYISDPVIVEDFVGSGLIGDVDGVGNQTMFEMPASGSYFLTYDKIGNLYFLSGNKYRGKQNLRKISSNGVVSTLADASNVDLFSNSPNENFYFVDKSDNRIIKTSTFLEYFNHKTGLDIRTKVINGFCVDSIGNIYLSHTSEHRIYKVDINGNYTVFAGSGNKGSADGTGIFCSFNNPEHLAIDSRNNIYVNDSYNAAIRVINQSKNVTTLVGKYRFSTSELDGTADIASISGIKGMTSTSDGNIIITDGTSIRIVYKTGFVKTIAGDYYNRGYKNGSGKESRFQFASDVVSVGNIIYVADDEYHPRIRKITLGQSSVKKPFNNINIKLSAGITINGTVGKKYSIESSSNGGKQWNALTELELSKTPFTWYDENSVGTNNLYRVFETP